MQSQNKSTPLLKRVDRLAKAAANSHPRIDRGLVVGKIGRAKIKGTLRCFLLRTRCLSFVSLARKRLDERENRFVFEVFDVETSAYISKHFAYCTPVMGAQLHRQRGFRVRMNDNTVYPQILEVIEEVPLPKAERKKKPSAAKEIASR